jgi:hypothetical protein
MSRFSEAKRLSLIVLIFITCPVVNAAENECQAAGEYSFVCGLQNAEDLVLIPETKWIIASGMAPGAPIYLVDSQQKSWTEFYPADAPLARQDMATYGACPGSPDPAGFFSHGLNLQPGTDGHSTLYVVGHGEREAIEVFDVNANGDMPLLTWTGCVMLPEGMAANSVASFSDGSLVATVPLHPGQTITDAMAQKNTGAVYKWSPGDSGFILVEGTELPYGNGIEVSADEQEIFVASSGLFTVIAFSNSNPARPLRTTKPLAFVPDNLHMGTDGRLITAGLLADDPVCGNVRGPAEFDLAEFASCARPFIVQAIDPESMGSSDIVRGPANEHFSNITMALPVGDEIWIGSFTGDRIGYRALKQLD